MKKVIFLLIINSIGLSIFAQAYTIDTSFIPFFDIRNNSNVKIRDLIELPSSKVIITGDFIVNHLGQSYRNLISLQKSGNRNSAFTDNFRPPQSRDFHKISVRFYQISGGQFGNIIDTNNQFSTYPIQQWRSNGLKTVRCSQGTPYFYPDGSSIFPNGFSQTANGPCPIINPPDTFPGMYLVKVTPQGLWDSTFRAFPNYSPNGVVRYDSTRLLVYGFPGRFTHYNGVRVNGLCRIFHDGSLDTTFQSPLSDTLTQNQATPILTDSSGAFFLVGRFHVIDNGVKTSTLMKLNSDGSIAHSFGNYWGASFDTLPSFSGVGSIVQTSDQGYLVGGRFTSYQGVKKKNIVKLDPNGILEPQYFTGVGPDSNSTSNTPPSFLTYAQVFKILKSKFGGYYVAGDFLKWDGQPSQPIVRIHGLNTTVGIGEAGLRAEPRSEVSVYPNPTTGVFRIESELAFRSVEVFDLIGGLVLSERSSSVFDGASRYNVANATLLDDPSKNYRDVRFEYSASEKKHRDALFFNLTNFDAGIYFFKIELENGEVVTRKVVRQ